MHDVVHARCLINTVIRRLRGGIEQKSWKNWGKMSKLKLRSTRCSTGLEHALRTEIEGGRVGAGCWRRFITGLVQATSNKSLNPQPQPPRSRPTTDRSFSIAVPAVEVSFFVRHTQTHENIQSMKLHWMLLIVLVGGCSMPQPDVAVVHTTLQAYRIGVTTFDDFKRDTHLAMVEQTITNAPPFPQSYLMQQAGVPDQARPDSVVIYKPPTQKKVLVYEVPVGSPWKIYETGVSENFSHGVFSSTRKFVVGDIDKPISILSFDKQGQLVSISSIP